MSRVRGRKQTGQSASVSWFVRMVVVKWYPSIGGWTQRVGNLQCLCG